MTADTIPLCSSLLIQAINYTNSLYTQSFLTMAVISEWSPCPYLNSRVFFSSILSPLAFWEGRVWEQHGAYLSIGCKPSVMLVWFFFLFLLQVIHLDIWNNHFFFFYELQWELLTKLEPLRLFFCYKKWRDCSMSEQQLFMLTLICQQQ